MDAHLDFVESAVSLWVLKDDKKVPSGKKLISNNNIGSVEEG